MMGGVKRTSSMMSTKDWASSSWSSQTILLPSLLEKTASIKEERSGRAKARLIKRQMARVSRFRERIDLWND